MPVRIVNWKPVMEDVRGHDAEMRCEPCTPGVQRRERHAAIPVGDPVQVEKQFTGPGCGEHIVYACAPILRSLLLYQPRQFDRRIGLEHRSQGAELSLQHPFLSLQLSRELPAAILEDRPE